MKKKIILRLLLTMALIMAIGLAVSAHAQTGLTLAEKHTFFEESSLDTSQFLAQADTDTNKDTDNVIPSGTAVATAKKQEFTQEQINEMMNNPLGELWLLFLQNDFTFKEGDALDFLGEDTKYFNTTTFQPVMPFQLTDNWKYIFRPVFTVNSWDVPSISEGTPNHYPGGTLPVDVSFDRDFELGDTVLWNAFATNDMARMPDVYGFGFTAMLPTATDDAFGTGKWSAGPMALAFHIGPPGGWMYGVVAQQWWDFAGDSDRNHVNLTNIQYILFYRLTAETNIGLGSPNITANWDADSSNRWTVPVGIGWNTTTKIGRMPVKVGFEVSYAVISPEKFGNTWNFRLIFSPVIPKPAFSKKALF